MKLRALAVTTALVLAATGLSACSSKIGLAATVGGSHLTLKTVDNAVKRDAAPYVDQSSGSTIVPKQNVVGTWIINELIERAIVTKQGSPATKAQITDAEGVLRSLAGGDPETVFNKEATADGYTVGYTTLEISQAEHLIVLAHLLEPTKSSAVAFQDVESAQAPHDNLIALVAKGAGQVTVNARFGAWDEKGLALTSGADAGLPSFVKIGPDTQPGASATPAP